ncbi:hypothetical protein [Williamsia sp. DF01-3]|uniref:hypothetical protein n=1 Tax=Williamsia sp. DF01-3 TaxID=2934157 RepID=UPI001FF4C550|nr:hypothetical protein [Williamsia sp. DF01-3]MCK0518947.1 hypothetical protein [Williamsia sp. DF01-3]
MADTTGLGQAYIDAQKALLDRVVESSHHDVALRYAEAFRALVEHPPRNADPRKSVSD